MSLPLMRSPKGKLALRHGVVRQSGKTSSHHDRTSARRTDKRPRLHNRVVSTGIRQWQTNGVGFSLSVSFSEGSGVFLHLLEISNVRFPSFRCEVTDHSSLTIRADIRSLRSSAFASAPELQIQLYRPGCIRARRSPLARESTFCLRRS